MGGPIIRTGATPKFWDNWDRIFSDSTKKSKKKSVKAAKKTAAKKKKKK